MTRREQEEFERYRTETRALVEDRIIYGLARGLFFISYCKAYAEGKLPGMLKPCSVDPYAAVPFDTPQEFITFAARVIGRVEQANGRPLLDIYSRTTGEEGYANWMTLQETRPTHAQGFGFQLAMIALGTPDKCRPIRFRLTVPPVGDNLKTEEVLDRLWDAFAN